LTGSKWWASEHAEGFVELEVAQEQEKVLKLAFPQLFIDGYDKGDVHQMENKYVIDRELIFYV